MLALGFALAVVCAGPAPRVQYTLTLDSARTDVAHVTISLEGVPSDLRLAMKVHAEYDAKYWRYLDSLAVDGPAGSRLTREDSTAWRLALPGGKGTVRYFVRIQPPTRYPSGGRRVWMPFVRADGAMINPPDFFLYLPDVSASPTLTIHLPPSWQIATALHQPQASDPLFRVAQDAQTLLDSPILLGNLRSWSFVEHGTTFHVVYWPEPNAVVFDNRALVDAVHRLTTQALIVMGAMPSRDYWFLMADGAADALEHAASVQFGVPSARLAMYAQVQMSELAHEFFHTWNLVAIRPAGYNDLSYRPPARTPSLWIGEGATIYYADALRRRAGLVDSLPSRRDHLAGLLQSYYARPALRAVSPARASLAFGDSRATNSDATGGYYLQGELLANELDAVIRDSTRDVRSLDDVMRAMYVASQRSGYQGYRADDFERTADSVCVCRLDAIFSRQVRDTEPIDLSPALRRNGLRMVVDTLPPSSPAPGQTTPSLNVRVRLLDAAGAPAESRKRLAAWLDGRG